MTSSHLDASTRQSFSRLAAPLDKRSVPRLIRLFVGAVLACGRRTVTSWIRDDVAARLAIDVVKPMVADSERLTLALDDTPTQRYRPHVPGAGIHHNPNPGPAGSRYVYSHVFVVLGLLVNHKAWDAPRQRPGEVPLGSGADLVVAASEAEAQDSHGTPGRHPRGVALDRLFLEPFQCPDGFILLAFLKTLSPLPRSRHD